ncbi:MAG: LuxR C-terminal-related transcriptional regulator, partial [Spongiibacter sp.]|nr:LuxR C-terminal-related transcriptional regulator [Spongiibacter sp.]
PTLIARTNHGGLLAAQGRLQPAERLHQQSLQMAADRQALKLPATGGIYIALGDVLREWNDLAQAADYTEQGIALCRAWPGFADETLAGLLNLSRIVQAQGKVQEALDLLQEAEALAHTYGIPQWLMMTAIHRAELYLAQGRIGEAGRWARLQTERPVEAPMMVREKAQITLARWQLLQRAPEEALATLSAWLPLAEADGRTGAALAMWVLQAMAHYQARRLDQALILLSKALSVAEPGGYVRLFLDHGPPMAALLERARAQDVSAAYCGRLLAAFAADESGSRDVAASPAPPSLPNAPLLVEPLTEREREVLQLIGAGMSNPQIAAELVIAVTTVKTHVRNIYGKLNVSSRFQAVERARELNLI